MYVASLSVVDFRSYPAAEVELGPGVTTFVGANGEGKTNLIEAVGYLAHLGSHRVANDAPLVRRGADCAIVRAEIVAEGRRTRLELAINPGRANRGKVGGSPVTRQRDLLGHLRTVLFAPEDLALVKGEPADRRAFLDDLLVARAPRFAGVRADYERVIRQRNALLRSAVAARRGGGTDELLHTLEVWDAQLVTHGAELLAGRVHLVNLIDPLVGEAYLKVSDDDGGAGVLYASALGNGLTTDRRQLAQALTEALAQRRREELDRGVTLVGPHRDDLTIRLGDGPAKGYASHGESWSLALALRLASYELLRADAAHGQTPVLILDDVFAELDSGRRERLAALVAGAEQVLVTAAVGADVPEVLHGERWTVTAGAVRHG